MPVSPMLVVGHQDQVIGDFRIGGIVPGIIVERHRKQNLPAARFEGGGHFLEESLQVGLGAVRHFFEVDRQPLALVEVEKVDNFLQPRGAFDRIGEPFGQANAVPLAVDGILQQRKDRLVRVLVANRFQAAMIEIVTDADIVALTLSHVGMTQSRCGKSFSSAEKEVWSQLA